MKLRERILACMLALMLLVGLFPAGATDLEEEAPTGRAGLHMAYLGLGDAPTKEAQPLPDTSEWTENTEFWVGVYVDGLTNLDLIPQENGLNSHIIWSTGQKVDGGIYSTCVGLQYASLYVEPVALQEGDSGYTGVKADDQKTFLKDALCSMPQWSEFSGAYRVAAASYDEPQMSLSGGETAGIPQEDRPKLMYLNMKSSELIKRIYFGALDDQPLYLLVAKFRITAMPNQGVKLFSLALDPVHSALQTGSNGQRWWAQWNQDRQITPDQNLKNHFDYSGDLNLEFQPLNIKRLKDGKYLEPYNTSGSFGGQPLVGSLPPGLTYTPSVGTITGTPTLAGDYVFRMGTNYYSIHIAKIPMDVKINDVDKSKVYGYPNPAFRIQYSGFINGENEQTMSFQNSLVPPTVTCEADEHTPVGAVPIELADGSSANYEFRYEESALSITPRNLKITKMTSVPRIPQNAPLSFQATADESQFEAEGLVTGDHVTLSFDVVYPESLTEGAKTVQIQNVVITDKNEGGNYKLLSAPTSAEGMVDSRQITGIELTAQPKLEYVYGEPLDLSGLRATIHYAGDTAPETGLRYTDLLERQIEILYEKDGKQFPAAQSDHLTVGVHNEAAVRFRAAGQLLGETQPLSVARRELEFRVSADSKAYDGGMNTSGTVRLLNAVEGDDVSAVGQFRFQDPNASNQLKDVEVALSLTGEDADNYTIAATAKAQAQIIRAARTEKVETPTVELDRMTNNLIVTSPLSDEVTEYEYSIGGGWQTSPIFTGLIQDRTYAIEARIPLSQNYSASEASQPLEIKTCKNKITLLFMNQGVAENVGVTFTDLEVPESVAQITAAFVERPKYDGYWLDKEYKVRLTYPYTLQKDNVFYVRRHTEEDAAVPGESWTAVPARIDGVVGDEPMHVSVLGKDGIEAGGVQWRSSDAGVATVDAEGNVILTGPGDAELFASWRGAEIATVQVTARLPGLVDSTLMEPYFSGYPDGSFRPDVPISRAEMADVLQRVLRPTAQPESPAHFSDVPEGTWYSQAVGRLGGLALLQGDPDGRFRPNSKMTRAEAAALICRAASLQGAAGKSGYPDCAGSWAEPFIRAVSEAGLMKGYPDGSFRPDVSVTRAEVAAIINRLIGAGEVENPEKQTVPSDASKDHWAYSEIVKAMNRRKKV